LKDTFLLLWSSWKLSGSRLGAPGADLGPIMEPKGAQKWSKSGPKTAKKSIQKMVPKRTPK
jgi:hypothetical protein